MAAHLLLRVPTPAGVERATRPRRALYTGYGVFALLYLAGMVTIILSLVVLAARLALGAVL